MNTVGERGIPPARRRRVQANRARMTTMRRLAVVDWLPRTVGEHVKGADGHCFVGRCWVQGRVSDASLLDAARLVSLDEAPCDWLSLPFKVPAIVEPLPKAPLGHVSVLPDAYDGEQSPSAFMNFSSVLAADTHRRLLLPLRRRECCVARPRPSCLLLVDSMWLNC